MLAAKSKLQKQQNYSGGSLREPVAYPIYHITHDFGKKKNLFQRKRIFHFHFFRAQFRKEFLLHLNDYVKLASELFFCDFLLYTCFFIFFEYIPRTRGTTCIS